VKSPPEAVAEPDSREARAWWIAIFGLLFLAVVTRASNSYLLPPLKDYDAAGHAVNLFALYEGHLPDLRSWSGFHPPLYYALGALLWHATPEGVDAHVPLRLLSLAAGAGATFWIFDVLARRFRLVDAAIVAVVIFCTPVMVIATSMLGNETACAFFVTGALAMLTSSPSPERSQLRHAAGAGLLAALAALSKATGLIAIATVVLFYAIRLRREPRRALVAALAAASAPLLLLTPLYAYLVIEAGSVSAAISGSVASVDARAVMAEQPPGVRDLGHYVSFPAAAVLMPAFRAPGLVDSVPGLFYATLQADAMGDFLPLSERALDAGRALALAGLLPTVLVVIGVVRALRAPRRFAWAAGPALFAAILAVAFLSHSWAFPHYSAVKASYALSGCLPAAIALGLGLDALPRRARPWLRAALLAVAFLDSILLWQGTWR
jgi:hypothetical protein